MSACYAVPGLHFFDLHFHDLFDLEHDHRHESSGGRCVCSATLAEWKKGFGEAERGIGLGRTGASRIKTPPTISVWGGGEKFKQPHARRIQKGDVAETLECQESMLYSSAWQKVATAGL